MTDIADYPRLKQVLADVINVHYDSLQHFNVCILPPIDREQLRLAYIDDAEENEIEEILSREEIAKELKRGRCADIATNNSIFERIYDIAQLMGPYLREIERSNNEKDRVDE